MAMELKHLNPQHVMDVTVEAIDEISLLRAENAELKRKLEEKDSFIQTLGEGQADLAREIERLKQKLEDAKASAYAESVDAGMENRRLKRALWLSRAATARNMRTYEALDNYVRNHLNRNSRWDYISSQRYDCWFYAWDNVEQKCLKKAEEYK